MYFPTRYATKLAAAALSLVAVTFGFTLIVNSQEPTQKKPTPGDEKATNAAPADPAPTAKPSPRLGKELDERTIVTNTDLITLTVTVTDTYGRYVSGL